MKITAVETFLMQVGARARNPNRPEHVEHGGSRNWLFLRILTDEGVYGVGECSGWPRVVERAVHDYTHLLVGENPRHIEKLWYKLFVSSMGHGMLGTVGAGALSGIEMALWDIKGKVLGQPV